MGGLGHFSALCMAALFFYDIRHVTRRIYVMWVCREPGRQGGGGHRVEGIPHTTYSLS